MKKITQENSQELKDIEGLGPRSDQDKNEVFSTGTPEISDRLEKRETPKRLWRNTKNHGRWIGT